MALISGVNEDKFYKIGYTGDSTILVSEVKKVLDVKKNYFFLFFRKSKTNF